MNPRTLKPLKNAPFCSIPALGSNFNPRNTQCMYPKGISCGVLCFHKIATRFYCKKYRKIVSICFNGLVYRSGLCVPGSGFNVEPPWRDVASA